VIWPNCYEHTVVVASWTLQDVKEELSFTAARRWCAFQGSHCRFPKFIGKKRLRDRMRALGTVLKVPSCRVQVLRSTSDDRTTGDCTSRVTLTLSGSRKCPTIFRNRRLETEDEGGPSRDIDHRVVAVLSSSLR